MAAEQWVTEVEPDRENINRLPEENIQHATTEEVRDIIRNSNLRKAPGHDDIENIPLKYLLRIG